MSYRTRAQPRSRSLCPEPRARTRLVMRRSRLGHTETANGPKTLPRGAQASVTGVPRIGRSGQAARQESTTRMSCVYMKARAAAVRARTSALTRSILPVVLQNDRNPRVVDRRGGLVERCPGYRTRTGESNLSGALHPRPSHLIGPALAGLSITWRSRPRPSWRGASSASPC